MPRASAPSPTRNPCNPSHWSGWGSQEMHAKRDFLCQFASVIHPSTQNSHPLTPPPWSQSDASKSDNTRAGPWPWPGRHSPWCGRCGGCPGRRANSRNRRAAPRDRDSDSDNDSKRCDCTRPGTYSDHDSTFRVNDRFCGGLVGTLQASQQHPRASIVGPRGIGRHKVQTQGRTSQRNRARSHRRGADEDTGAEERRGGKTASAPQPWPGPRAWSRSGRVPAWEHAGLDRRRAVGSRHEL
jgi:hypothetical protein